MKPTVRNICIGLLLLTVVVLDFASKTLSIIVDGVVVGAIGFLLYGAWRTASPKE
jgi:TRAP-type C4-dicarboxylate transport system permease small subunit